MKKITSLHVIAKEWFDKVNGNSYFSARVQVNEETIYLPFQYGYESAYIQATHKELQDAGYECGDSWNVSRWTRENNVVASFQLIDKQLQRDVKSWGKK